MTFHDNPSLRRSLRGLAHPLTIAAVIVLLLNDHLFRVVWPAWWTGKLGDFAWLAFFPLVLAAPLSLIVPARVRRQEAIVAGLAFGLTGLMFATMKTIPAAMEAGLWLLRQITGGLSVLRVDPTDLLALPGLLAGWWVWRQSGKPAPAMRGWAILALGAMATLANTSLIVLNNGDPYPRGIVRLKSATNGNIMAQDTAYGPMTPNVFSSVDGGLTWTEGVAEGLGGVAPEPDHATGETWQLADPDNDQLVYRFTPGTSIERSDDGGKTWKPEIDVSWTQPQLAFDFQSPIRSHYLRGGPFDAVIDKKFGTLVVAMGGEGVLTRTPDGQWHWADVFEYIVAYNPSQHYSRRSDVHTPQEVGKLLTIQIWLAAALLCLAPGLLSFPAKLSFPSIPQMVWGFLACGVWWAILVFSPLNFDLTGQQLFSTYGILPLAGLSIAFAVVGLDNIITRFKTVPGVVGLCMVAAPLLFIVPYILWSQDITRDAIVATVLAAGFSWVLIGLCGWQVFKQARKLQNSQNG